MNSARRGEHLIRDSHLTALAANPRSESLQTHHPPRFILLQRFACIDYRVLRLVSCPYVSAWMCPHVSTGGEAHACSARHPRVLHPHALSVAYTRD